MGRRLLAALLAIVGTSSFGLATARASMPSFGSHDVLSVFHIAKSRNRNQVHYGIQLDARCRPVGPEPVYVYWREFERGPRVVSPLLRREKPAYGLASQEVEARADDGGRVRVHLRSVPDRPLVIDTFLLGDECSARAVTEIRGQPAVLEFAFLQLGSLWSIRHVALVGSTLQGDSPIREILER